MIYVLIWFLFGLCFFYDYGLRDKDIKQEYEQNKLVIALFYSFGWLALMRHLIVKDCMSCKNINKKD